MSVYIFSQLKRIEYTRARKDNKYVEHHEE